MSINDPHLEAQMELESRYPNEEEPPPAGFARAQAWVLLAIVAIVVAAWVIYVFVR